MPGDPDPTLLTTEALLREVAHVRELYDGRLDQLDLRLQQRFDAQSKALDAALAAANAKTDTLSVKIDELRSSRDSIAGKSAGVAAIGGWIVAGVGLVATIISIAVVVSNHV